MSESRGFNERARPLDLVADQSPFLAWELSAASRVGRACNLSQAHPQIELQINTCFSLRFLSVSSGQTATPSHQR